MKECVRLGNISVNPGSEDAVKNVDFTGEQKTLW
jgi:hypothetical protein